MDEYILRFFGSEENVRVFAHLYVLEIQPPESMPIQSYDENLVTFEIETRYRLRLKTPEELGFDN